MIMSYQEIKDSLYPREEKLIEIDNFEECPPGDVRAVLSRCLDHLVPGGEVEFGVLNWQWCTEYIQVHSGPDIKLSEILFDGKRRSLWTEKKIAIELLQSGFHRVWTGKVLEQPEYLLWTKGLKKPEQKGGG